MRAFVLLVCLTASLPADARCVAPRPFVVPRAGAVPENPVFFAFLPHGTSPMESEVKVVSGAGASLPFTVQRTPGEAYDVLRIAVTAAEGTKLRVKPFHLAALKVTKQAGATELTLSAGAEENYAWTCSYEATRVLVPSFEAPAFRVTVARDAAGLDAPGATTVLVPGRAELFFRPTNTRLALRLGHLNCLGYSLVWREPSVARVTALLADGAEVVAQALVNLEPLPARQGEGSE